MTTAQVAETSVTGNNSPNQNYVHADGHVQPTYQFFKLVINEQVV